LRGYVLRSLTETRTLLLSTVIALMLLAMPCAFLRADTVTGTAFFVSSEGYAVTCAHVVKDATEVQLAIAGKTFKASIIAVDEKNDVAVLKVEASGQPTIPIGLASKVEAGARVWVLGFPLASMLGDTVKVTSGTISGVTVQGTQRIIQIDAAVNPGNSGGPLLNDGGEVIGVVNAKIVGAEVAGVGFAIPINYAVQLLRNEGVALEGVAAKAALDGAALTRKAGPAVALVKATVPLKEPVLIKSLPVGACLSASFSNDGKTLICAGGSSNKATIWSVETGKAVQSFIGLTREDFKPADQLDESGKRWVESCLQHPSVWNATFSPDGRLAACVSLLLLMLLDVETGKRLRTFPSALLGTEFAFTPDGQWFLHGTGWDGGEIQCLNMKTGEESALGTKSCSGISVSPCSKFAAVCYGTRASAPHSGGTIEILEVPNGKLVRKINGSRADIGSLCYSPDGRYIAGAETDASGITADSYEPPAGMVTIWDAESGAVVRNITCPGMSPGSVQYSPDGKVIAVLLRPVKIYALNDKLKLDLTVALYDPTTGEPTALLPGRLAEGNCSGSFSPDSSLLAVVGDETVNIWQVK
jgi:WD40 repeat protein